MSFITAEGVSFSWGQARILQEVSLCAGKGKFVRSEEHTSELQSHAY